jgi:cell division septation protein DedD
VETAVAPPEPEPAPPVEEAPPVQVAALPAPEPERDDEAAFTLQVGAFRKSENSEKVIRDLASRGYQPYTVALKGSRSRVLHTVRVGRYNDRGEAQKAATELRQRAGIAAVVIGS